MQNRVKAILFDLGNVTVNFDHNFAVDKIINLTHKMPQEIYQLFFDSNITGLFEEGKVSSDDFYQRVNRMLGLGISYESFKLIWNEIFFLTEDNYKIHSLIKKFKNRLVLVLVSNINKLHYEYLIKRYDIFKEFDKFVLSYEVGVRKPDPLIYKKALDEAGVAIEEVIYIDDREDLISEAKKIGIRSIRFNDYEQLNNDLEKIGVI